MQASGWLGLVRLIPPDFHDGLIMVLSNGFELNIQNILRLEDEYMVFRGRMMGSTDAGLIFFAPYDQIASIAYAKAIKENVIIGWFTEPSKYDLPMPEAPISDGAEPAAVEQEPEAAAEGAPEPQAAPAAKPAAPARPVPTVPAPRPAAAARPTPAPLQAPAAPVSISAGMPLPAKAAMIERLRKRAGGPQGGSPPPKAPEQS
jgi:hypothetical protein